MMDSPLLYLPKRAKFGSHSVPRNPAKVAGSLRLDPLNTSKDSPNMRTKKKIFQYNSIISPNNRFVTESPSPLLHDRSLKETEFTRSNSPVKLEKIPSSINVNGGTEWKLTDVTSIRNRPRKNNGIQSYLNYLGSGSVNDLSNFRKRIEPKNKAQPVEYDPHFNHHWLHEFFPQEVKKIPFKGSDIEHSPSSQNIKTEQALLFPKKINTDTAEERPKRASVGKRSLSNLPRLEQDLNMISPHRLAEEISTYYKSYQEHFLRNKAMHEEVTEFLKQQNVYDAFVGKGEKHVPLQTRIYNHMTERHFEGQEKEKKKTKGSNHESLSHSRENSSERHEAKRDINVSRYNAYKKVHEKLQDLNIEVKVQELQGLEMKLVQAHRDLSNQKELVLKNVAKVNPRKVTEIKQQVEATERMIPMYKDLVDERRDPGELLKEEDISKTTKEIKTVNRTLNKVIKNWQMNLMNQSPKY